MHMETRIWRPIKQTFLVQTEMQREDSMGNFGYISMSMFQLFAAEKKQGIQQFYYHEYSQYL